MNLRCKETRDLIAFYLDAGVDTLVGEEPVDRMADDALAPAVGGKLDSEAVGLGTVDQGTHAQGTRADVSPSLDRRERSSPPAGAG